ncbi:hypothetical protein [Helicobacter sp. 11S03491-1]|uniref:hypothetical protein n=1 Tax=Helicobacter sp. 11S03491-1 TaxID=1476196 RepID=UPI000BA6FFC3|nr:hypothetical protein [Helicobacter sp. 11S03491-1]PAF43319.1 hypothetical protein BKH45_01380 [Helicobacter sp. 11S03491-1]
MFAINGVVCEKPGLSKNSRADLAFCKKDSIYQKPEDIQIIFEIKMSIVHNYEFFKNEIKFIGDYRTHKALPSLMRSDSVLKAIGKAINIRVSSELSRNIPIVVLGNSHISDNYLHKIDHLGQYGVLQKMISMNPNLDINKESPSKYFQTPQNLESFYQMLKDILVQDFYYFSAMLDKKELGKIIKESSSSDNDEIQIAEKFLKLLKKR